MGHILLVEDDLGAVALIRQSIEQLCAGYRLGVFSMASEALVYAGEHRIDLFILDIQLSDYRGTTLARQLRAIPAYRFTPILFTTELAGEELSAYRTLKCHDFLVKPFTPAEFQRAVQSALALGDALKKEPEPLRIVQKQFIFEYELKHILYIESFGKRLVIHTMTGRGEAGEDTISGYSLAGVLELVGQGRLLQCHKSFLVNPEHICKLDKSNRLLYLDGCDVGIPVGEKFHRDLWERER